MVEVYARSLGLLREKRSPPGCAAASGIPGCAAQPCKRYLTTSVPALALADARRR